MKKMHQKKSQKINCEMKIRNWEEYYQKKSIVANNTILNIRDKMLDSELTCEEKIKIFKVEFKKFLQINKELSQNFELNQAN